MHKMFITTPPPPPPPHQSSSGNANSGFALICVLHSIIALFSGSLMMFNAREIYSLSHGVETAGKLIGSTPHDQLLIRTSDSFAGLLLLAIGLLLLMVAGVKDREFQDFFAKGCTILHVLVAAWRFVIEREVEDLAWDSVRLTVADFSLAFSWLLFVVYSWAEKYD